MRGTETRPGSCAVRVGLQGRARQCNETIWRLPFGVAASGEPCAMGRRRQPPGEGRATLRADTDTSCQVKKWCLGAEAPLRENSSESGGGEGGR